MTKRYDDEIEVTSDPNPEASGAPLAFVWRGRCYTIDQWLASWREAGEWWVSRQSSPRDREYFRVLARPAESFSTGDIDPDGFLRTVGAVYDVYLDRARGGWRLARIWD